MFAVNWKEDSSCEVLGRVTARNGSGAATGVQGEGRFLQQADVSSITVKVYDITNDPSGASPIHESTLTVSTVILNTIDDSNEVWTQDTNGYNFRHSIANTIFTTGGNIYRIEYKFTLTGGMVFHEIFEGPANSILQS